MPSEAPPNSMFCKSVEMDATLQKYLLLSSQQESLRLKLCSTASNSSTSSSPMQSATRVPSVTSSLANSPPCYFSMPTTSYLSSPTDLYPLPPATFGPGQFAPSRISAITGDPEDSGSDDELFDLNQAIKATLTELLNREEIKHDEQLRLWVQSRLMDTQLEMRRQRRRRSSGSENSYAPLQRPVDIPRTTATPRGRSRGYSASVMPILPRRNTSIRSHRGHKQRHDSYLMAGG